MKTRCLFLLVCLLVSWQAYGYTERNLLQREAGRNELERMLVPGCNWVPYPAYTDRAAWESLFGSYKDSFIRKGEQYLDYRWEVVTATDYMEFERSGDRQQMEAPFGRNNRALVSLFLAELAEGKGRFTDQLINGVFLYCEMTSWSLSAHLTVQHSKRSLPDYKENIIDLTSGDFGAILSWVYYFFHTEFDRVNPVISERLRAELQTRILEPYMNEDRFWWMGFGWEPGRMLNNWNPWCNANVLQCFLLLENDPARRAGAVYRTMQSVDRFLNYIHADGACEEGPSYWGHAAGKLFDYLQVLSYGTGGRMTLFKEPMIRRMGEYIARSYVGNGWVVNFADASARGGGDPLLIYRYGRAVGSDEMKGYAAALMQRSGKTDPDAGRDVFRTLQALACAGELSQTAPALATPPYTWYPETEFCYMRANGWFFTAKGGFNNESHNHNDVGTFSLYLNAVPVLIDAGVGTYTCQTFSSERYTIWTMQSDYHNLPAINGVAQAFGSRYRAAGTKFDARRNTFSADIAPAYPAEAKVRQWVRTYALSGNGVRITDAFELEEAVAPNRLRFLTWGETDCSEPGKVKIVAGGEQVVLSYDKNAFVPEVDAVPLTDPRLSTVWGDAVRRITLRAVQPVKKGKYVCTIRQSEE
ncbi:MAG: heparinase II/III-family protein [Parabacteroides sp.]|nr:heparinase II/III-family protein [Parabacteroides sp.]